jgi:hypothetical protein
LRKSLLIAATTAVLLVAAASAYAAINTYTARFSFTSSKAGTVKKPVATGFTYTVTAGGTHGNRSAVLESITTKVYGLKANLKALPTCSLKAIANAKSDTGCPKAALVATGYIHAVVGPATDFTSSALPCNPGIDVWNSGGGKLTFFFVDGAVHNCDALGLKTGNTGPFASTEKQQGKNLVVATPIPTFVTHPLNGLAGSLQLEYLKWNKSAKVKGKKVNVLTSVGCQKGKRPWSATLTATLPTTNTTETKTVSGKSTCK